ncbi:hypothetical protein B296_00028070, partial [Ensete ventricosum]
WKRLLAAAPSRCCLAVHHIHVASLALTTSLGAFSSALGGCASTISTLGMQCSPGPSSFSWASSSPPPPTSSSLIFPPDTHTIWCTSSPLPPPLTSPISTSSPSFITMASYFLFIDKIDNFLNLNYIYHYINNLF